MKTLYIMCGAPASGKTWFAKHNLCNGPGWYYVSRDEVRFSLLKDDEDYFSREDEVFNLFISKIVRGFYEEGVYNIVADATHLNWGSRKKLLDAIKFYMGFRWKEEEINVIPVVINTDYETIVERNNKREGRAKVPENALREMCKRMRDPKGDPYHYTAIMRVTTLKFGEFE